MNVTVDISVQKDLATPALQARIDAVDKKRLGVLIGPALKNATQDHLLANGQNKRGWPTTNFWARAAKATSWSADENGNVTIRIDQIGVRQRYHGGPISPKPAGALTIPISPEAYGKRASEFTGAFLIHTKRGAYIVQRGTTFTGTAITQGNRKRGLQKDRVIAPLEFLFKLSQGVDQEADPSIVPSDLALVALARLEKALTPKGNLT